MRTFLFMMNSLMTISSQEGEEEMQKYLNDTEEMIRLGKHQKALERCVWFHNHALEYDPGMYGVRLSFALHSWKLLGNIYPPAKKALFEIRDRKTHQVENGEGDTSLFHDVASLNETLEEESKTTNLFEQLDRKNPEFANQCWKLAKDNVISAKRFDLVQKYMENPIREFTGVKAAYDENLTFYANPQVGGVHFKEYNENHFIEECLRLIEVAIHLGNQEAAQQIQKKALEVVDDIRLRGVISKENMEDGQREDNPEAR